MTESTYIYDTDIDSVDAYLENTFHYNNEGFSGFTTEEIRSILSENLQKYFIGERTQGFIVELASSLMYEGYEAHNIGDAELLDVLCKLSSINDPSIQSNPHKSSEEIDAIIRAASEQLISKPINVHSQGI